MNSASKADSLSLKLENTTITHFIPTNGTVRKNLRALTVTIHQADTLSKTINFSSSVTCKLELFYLVSVNELVELRYNLVADPEYRFSLDPSIEHPIEKPAIFQFFPKYRSFSFVLENHIKLHKMLWPIATVNYIYIYMARLSMQRSHWIKSNCICHVCGNVACTYFVLLFQEKRITTSNTRSANKPTLVHQGLELQCPLRVKEDLS